MTDSERDRVDTFIDEWRAVRPGLDVAALGVTNRLVRMAHIIQAKLDQVAAGHGMSHKGDLDVLTALLRSPDGWMTPTELAGALLLTTGGMTTRLDRLEGAGLVTRRQHPADRRSVLVTLTPEGNRVADRAFRDVLEAQTAFVASLTQPSRDLMIESLRRLLVDSGDTLGT